MTEPDTDEGSAPVVVYATFPDFTTADTIGRSLVEGGLAACVNLIPGMRSIYRWQGSVEDADEVVAIIKTTRDGAIAVTAAIEVGHPHDTPAVVVLPVVAGSSRYVDWIRAEVTTRVDR